MTKKKIVVAATEIASTLGATLIDESKKNGKKETKVKKTNGTVKPMPKPAPLPDAMSVRELIDPSDKAPTAVSIGQPFAAPTAPVQVAPQPVAKPAPKPAPVNPLLAQILKAGKKQSGTAVAEALETAHAVLSPEGAKAFVDALTIAEELAVGKMSFNQSREFAFQDWCKMTLSQQEARLQGWAKAGDVIAAGVIETLNAFRKSTVDVITPMMELVDKVVLPAKAVQNYTDLSNLIRDLQKEGLVEGFVNKHLNNPKAVLIGFPRPAAYLPAMERGQVIAMAEAGWQFVKEAEEVAKKDGEKRNAIREDKMRQLKDQATLLPGDELGKEGTVFLRASERVAALLQIRKSEKGYDIRISRSIGIPDMPQPTGWVDIEIDARDWPDRDLYRAFQAWWKG